MNKQFDDIKKKLQHFKRKFYFQLLLKGALLFGVTVIGLFLLVNLCYDKIYLDSSERTFIFFIVLLVFIILFFRWLVAPLLYLTGLKQGIKEKQFAIHIGNHFPEIKDKLLNIIQLSDLENDLVLANLRQKMILFSKVNFSQAINWEKSKKYAKLFFLFFIIVSLLLVFIPSFLYRNTEKFIKYNQEFEPELPFHFQIATEGLIAFRNESFDVRVGLEGIFLPEKVFISTENRRLKMHTDADGLFAYHFDKVNSSFDFRFESEGYYSKKYTIQTVNRPHIQSMDIQLIYPRYLNKRAEYLKNSGHLLIPEGTRTMWKIHAPYAQEVSLVFGASQTIKMEETEHIFFGEKTFFKDINYEIKLKNKFSNNPNPLKYNVEVVNDEYPQIELKTFQDSTFYKFIILSGTISDDYGFNRLELKYRINDENQYYIKKIPIRRKNNPQKYFYQFYLDSINILLGNRINYFLKIYDNDGINGPKFTKTINHSFQLPKKNELEQEINKNILSTENQIEKVLEKAKKLRHSIKKSEERIKSKKVLDWKNQKALKQLLEKRFELEEEIKKMQALNEITKKQEEVFNQENKEVIKKNMELQKLMNEVLDEETKKLYRELQQLMKESLEQEKVQEIVEQLNIKEQTLENELEQSLELFKKLKFEKELNSNIQTIRELEKKQTQIIKDSKEKNDPEESIEKRQDELNKAFDKFEEKMKEMVRNNNKRKKPANIDKNIFKDQRKIKENLNESLDMLKDNKKKKSQKQQQAATDNMKKLGDKLQRMKENIEKETLSEDINNIKNVLEGLIKTSFEEERLMDAFKNTTQADPRYVSLAQAQLDLVNNSKIIRDSLQSLGNRVTQISGFVNEKLEDIEANFKKVEKNIKDRKPRNLNANQHKTMTSVNDLALLLNSIKEQMMQQKNGMGGKGKMKSSSSPSLSQLQKSLSEKIKKLKNRNLKGRKLSKELAQSAAQQEKLRQMLNNLKSKMKQKEALTKSSNGKGKGKNRTDGKNRTANTEQSNKPSKEMDSINKLEKLMEENERDLVNKNLNDGLFKRQEEIITRMLEAEKAVKEKDYDDERKGKTANLSYERLVPKSLKQYLKKARQESELINSIPVKLNPYFKKEANKYFKRINSIYSE